MALATLQAQHDVLAAHLAAALERIDRLEANAFPGPSPTVSAIEAERERRFVPRDVRSVGAPMRETSARIGDSHARRPVKYWPVSGASEIRSAM